MEDPSNRWESLRRQPRRWFVTGVAGFIGSHLLESLLDLGQSVAGLDNFRTGHPGNLDDVRRRVGEEAWGRFRFRPGDISRAEEVDAALAGERPDFVLHQAALGSVPQSIEDPAGTHAVNVTGFLHVLLAARAAGVKRVVYASSSAVYGDATESPAREGAEGAPLSPYALSKSLDEAYAALFEKVYGLPAIGLRYFNVFGPRQDPRGAYAAVIPRWIEALAADRPVEVFGDGETSRDFCPVANVVEANLRAATATLPDHGRRVFNIGLGSATTLNRLFELLRAGAARWNPAASTVRPQFRPFRPGDVRHSCADSTAATRDLGYHAIQTLEAGLAATVDWYAERRRSAGPETGPGAG